MCKVINEWSPLNDNKYILLLDSKIPDKKFEKCHIEGKAYELIHVHVSGENLLKTIAIKGEGNFVGKKVEFI